MDVWYALIITGVICGIFSALFGVGGGLLMVPAMVVGMGISQKSAQGMSLAIIIPLALVGAIRYKLNPQVDFDIRIVMYMAIGGIMGAFLGSHLVGYISGVTLKRAFSILMIFIAIHMFMTAGRENKGKAVLPSAEKMP